MVLNAETLDWMVSVTSCSTTNPGETFAQGTTNNFVFTSEETVDVHKTCPIS